MGIRHTVWTNVGIPAMIALLYTATAVSQTFEFKFDEGTDGWAPDFADYVVGDSVNWGLSWEIRAIPEIEPARNALFMEGDNLSDDLFFFLKRRVTGLIPNAEYSIDYTVEVATDEGPEIIGGSSLMMKAGATTVEPKKVVVQESHNVAYYRMNIDKANQFGPGPDMDTIGEVHHSFASFHYHLFTLDNEGHPFHVKADESGAVWLIVGAEGAYEDYAKMYVAGVTARFSQTSGVVGNDRNESGLFVAPNPALDWVRIGGMTSNDVDVRLFDFLGREILAARLQADGALDVSALPGGLYTVRLSESGGTDFIDRRLFILK